MFPTPSRVHTLVEPTESVFFHSPIGWVRLTATTTALIGLEFVNDVMFECDQTASEHRILRQALHELREYFTGRRQEFSIPVQTLGTSFQQQVWQGLQTIPFGGVMSYGELADQIGHPRSMRALGNANGRNPIAIIVPCHRVVATGGKLGGYSSGLDKKLWLLAHEGVRLG